MTEARRTFRWPETHSCADLAFYSAQWAPIGDQIVASADVHSSWLLLCCGPLGTAGSAICSALSTEAQCIDVAEDVPVRLAEHATGLLLESASDSEPLLNTLCLLLKLVQDT